MSLLLTLAIGCASGPYGAPEGSTITVSAADFGDIEGYVFDVAYAQAGDGLGLLIKEWAYVETPVPEGNAGSRLGLDQPAVGGSDILVEITSGYSGAYVIPATAVSVVDTYAEGCEGDASEECGDWFDIGTDRYVEFSGDYQDLGGLRPTYMSGATDNRGVLDFYVFIDSVPIDDEGEAIPIPLYASIGVDIVSWSYDFE